VAGEELTASHRIAANDCETFERAASGAFTILTPPPWSGILLVFVVDS
jgi:hypothetical protein